MQIPAFSPWFAFAQLPSTTRSSRIFGDVTFKITDSFDVVTGLRKPRRTIRSSVRSAAALILVTANRPGVSPDEDVFTYTVSPRWHLSDDTMLYGRVASGFRPGGPSNIVLNLAAVGGLPMS